MKITSKLLSIPPFISTSWTNIASLFIREKKEKKALVISLLDGTSVEVYNLSEGEIDEIFQAHAKFSEESSTLTKDIIDSSLSFSLPIKSDSGILDSLGAQMQCNPDQSDLPPIPPHIMDKITTVIKSLGVGDSMVLDQPEEGCHCVYCQILRAMNGESEEMREEIVDDADLTFRDWEVSQKEDKLYEVKNPLDPTEHYDVFLGEPLGCTCGQKNCEHIKAVLNT
jgi:hypothetical protein